MSLALPLCAEAATAFNDGFEGAALDPFWTAQQQNGTIAPSSLQPHTGTQSVRMTRTTGGQLGLSLNHVFAEAEFGTASVWFYDSVFYCYASFVLENTTAAKSASIGVQDWDYGNYYWNSHISSGSVGARAPGWHLFSITTGPTNQIVTLDGAVLFSGTNENIGFNKVSLNASGPGGSGSYFCDDFSLTQSPVIVGQPQSRGVAIGSEVTFAVTAVGLGSLSYQWQFNNADLSEATGASLTLTNVQLSYVGDYRVIVTNETGSVTSSVAALTISSPIITEQPQNQNVPLGSNATFVVTATGPGVLAYQWQFNSANLAGATNDVLLITNAQPSSIGDYRVIISNDYGSATSSVATLTLLLPPTVTTLAASNVSAWKATLRGTVNPHGTNATAWFEWGATTSYGNVTPVQPLAGGSSAVTVSAAISNLTHLASYHYRLVASNVVFRTDGTDAAFTTLAARPVVSSFSPVVGTPGTIVTITGSNLTGVTYVGFEGIIAEFTVVSDNQITAVVPAGTAYGQIVVAGPGGVGASAGGFVVRPTDSIIAGPFFPPPLDCSFSESSSPDEGAIGRTGGKTWYLYNVALANSAVVYWGATNQGVRLSFVRSPFPQPYLPAEILSYASNLSDLPGGVLVWTGQTRLPPNMTTVYTRFTLRVKDVYDAPLSLMNAAGLGLPDNIGAVLVVTPDLVFQANMLFEASFSLSGPYYPALEFYDAQSTPAGGGTAYTSFAGGFFYENTRPVFTSGPFADVSVPGNTSVGPIYFTFTDAETGASSVSILPCVSTNQALLPNGNIPITRTAANAAFLRAYPLAGQSGKTVVTVSLTDGGATSSQPFLLTVNNPPRLDRNDPLYTTQGAARIVGNTLLAASDAENPAAQLTYTVAPGGMGGPPHHGWLRLNGTNLLAGDTFTQEDINLDRLSYLHDGACATNDDFTFNVSDPDGGVTPTGEHTTYTFRINVAPANHPPVAFNGTANVGLNATFNGVFSVTDTDCPPVLLTFRVLTNGTKGTLVLTDTSTGAFSYTASIGQTGDDTVVFQVNDGTLDAVSPGVFTFTIENQAPTSFAGSGTTMEDQPFQGLLSATDPDLPPQTLNYRVVTNSLKGAVSIADPATGAFVYLPDPGAIGTDVFSFVANDGTLDSVPAAFTITIRPNLDPGDIVVADASGRRLVLIDTAGAQFVLSESNLLTDLHGIAIEPSGSILLVDQLSGVLRVNPASGAQTVLAAATNFSTTPLGPIGIAVERDGSILVADGVEGIKHVHPVSGAISVLSSGGSLVLPAGVTVAPNGDIFVADLSALAGQASRIVRLDPASGAQTIVSSGANLVAPVGIAMDKNGMLVVSDAATFGGGSFDSVLRIDPASGAQTVLATNNLLSLPTGIATASGGRVLIANGGSGAVVQIDGTTGEQAVLASGGSLLNPFAVAVVHRLELRSPSVLPDRRFHCLVYGEPGETYLLQSSADLKTWSTAGWVTNDAVLVEFIDPTAPGQPWRFYRARPQ